MRIPLYAEDLRVRKKIKVLIDVVQNITKHMLEMLGGFTVSVMMTAEVTVLRFPSHQRLNFLYSDI